MKVCFMVNPAFVENFHARSHNRTHRAARLFVAIEALVLGGPESVRVVLNSSSTIVPACFCFACCE